MTRKDLTILTLNIWGGRMYEPLCNFIAQQALSVDVFCFQEVYANSKDLPKVGEGRARTNIHQEIQRILTNHTGLHFPAVKNLTWRNNPADTCVDFGLSIFVRQSLELTSYQDIFVFNEERGFNEPSDFTSLQRNLAWVTLSLHDKKIVVANLHGLWNNQGKTDCPERIRQSKKVDSILTEMNVPHILCGDFNLLPHTQSLNILAKNRLDLIRENQVKSTRSSLYLKPEKLADYVFTSGVDVEQFKVLTDEVSDHLALKVTVRLR